MKLRHTLLPLAAVVGVGIAIVAVVQGGRARQASPSASKAGDPDSAGDAQAPFAHEVAGTGVVEAGTGNIAIGTPVPGIVASVPVRWGEAITAGATLFQLDDRELRADIPLMTAHVKEAEARLAQARYQLRLADEVHAQRLLSEEQYRDRRYATQIDEAALAAAKAELERVRVEIARRTIVSPVDGRVLQINVRPGEFAESGALATPLMVVGDDTRLRVRVDIDEHDANRVDPAAPAIAMVRGRPDLHAPCTSKVSSRTSCRGDR